MFLRIQFLTKILFSKFSPVADTLVQTHRKSTVSLYQNCWKNFQDWLLLNSNLSLSKSTLLLYLNHLSESRNLNPKRYSFIEMPHGFLSSMAPESTIKTLNFHCKQEPN